MKQLFFVLIVGGLLVGCSHKKPAERINITMKKYEFVPAEIHVKRGQRVLFVVTSADTQHGFHVDAFGINEPVKKGQTAEVEFQSDKAGTFPMNCSIICGAMHDDMVGKIVVE
jgi:heme/copper-type cytochrome/quinol oxidase subunit 2